MDSGVREPLDLDGGRLWVLEDGLFITDAGNILGDTGGRKMRIRGAMHAVLIEVGEDLVLVDAGFGPSVPEALEGRYELRREKTLPEAIKETGHPPENVTKIVLSHLDPDHVGWALHSDVFPNARVFAQREALDEARSLEDDDGRHLAVAPVERGVREGWFELQDGDREVAPGVRTEVRAGHSAGHQVVRVQDEFLYTADLAPSRIFLNPDLIAGVDSDPELARRNRIEILSEAERSGLLVVLYHEPKDCLVRVSKNGDSFEGSPVEM